MSINFIVAIKTTVAEKLTVGGEFKRSQTCQHDQMLYRNEYNSYLVIIESQQLKNEVIFFLAEVKHI